MNFIKQTTLNLHQPCTLNSQTTLNLHKKIFMNYRKKKKNRDEMCLWFKPYTNPPQNPSHLPKEKKKVLQQLQNTMLHDVSNKNKTEHFMMNLKNYREILMKHLLLNKPNVPAAPHLPLGRIIASINNTYRSLISEICTVQNDANNLVCLWQSQNKHELHKD